MKRLFVAVHISENSRGIIYRELCSSPAFSGIRKSSMENLHLTLSFLGETDERRIPELKQSLQNISVPGPISALRFTTVGAFPDTHKPRVIWLGIEPNRSLDILQRKIRTELDGLHINYDRKPFKAHLTLGRVPETSAALTEASIRRLQETDAALRIPDSPLRYVVLYESVLQPGGPVYKALMTKELLSAEQ